jgi:vibriolysin
MQMRDPSRKEFSMANPSAFRPLMRFALFALVVAVMGGGVSASEPRGLSAEQLSRLRELPAIDHLSVDPTGIPTAIEGRLGYIGFGPVERAVHGFIPTLLPLLRGNGQERFRTLRVEHDEDGQAHLRLEQQHRGLPIVGAELVIHVKEDTGEVTGVNGRLAPVDHAPDSPNLDSGSAMDRALGEAAIAVPLVLDAPHLTYIVDDAGSPHLAWAARVASWDEQGYVEDRLFADASDGHLLAKHGLIWRAKYRKIYDAGFTQTLPGTLLFQEGGSSSDVDAQKVYEYSGNTYDYFWSRHSRDSWNGSGGQIISTVHYGSGYNNAFWDGTQMAFGDGDGSTYNRFARGLDIVAHELTHGVTQATANLTYSNESGALNEAMSDIFGNATEAYVRGQSSNTWKVGEDIYTPGTSGDAMRYMNNPTQDGSSKDYYPERYTGGADYGGVHWNSGIANLAFYLLSQGGSHPRGKTSVVVPSIGMTTAERIFYKALKTYMSSSTNFQGARETTLQAANNLHGPCSSQSAAVSKAWDAVGVPQASGGGDYEPNDTLPQASTLQPYSSFVVGYLCTSGNADWYVINKVYSYSALSISLYPPASADYDLELLSTIIQFSPRVIT